MKSLLPFCLLLLASFAHAQLLDFPMKGKFHISVDDNATLFLNGRQVCKVGIGESTSPELLVEPGDRLVVKLYNKGGPKRFAMLFVSANQKTIISFRNQMWKILPDPDKGDFSKQDFEDIRRFADQINKQEAVRRFAYKNSAEWLWGIGNPCVLGSVLTRDYFKPLQQ